MERSREPGCPLLSAKHHKTRHTRIPVRGGFYHPCTKSTLAARSLLQNALTARILLGIVHLNMVFKTERLCRTPQINGPDRT